MMVRVRAMRGPRVMGELREDWVLLKVEVRQGTVAGIRVLTTLVMWSS